MGPGASSGSAGGAGGAARIGDPAFPLAAAANSSSSAPAKSSSNPARLSAAPRLGHHGTSWWLGGYLLVQLLGVGLTLSSQLSLAWAGLRASRVLARRLTTALICAPLSFFHANPLGRILNVATKDQRDVDSVLVTNLAITLMVSFSLVATLLVIVSSLWWTALLIAPLVAFFVRTRNTYQRSLIEIKR
jgi:ATP-binding cassette subfamily C (CFTR/MRP) protein 1